MQKEKDGPRSGQPHLEGGADKTDEELVGLALANQGYFVFLVDRYEHKLLRYIKRITSVGPEGSEDILQDVFIKIYQSLNDFDTDLKFSSWAYRITRNQVISSYRKTEARPKTSSLELSENTIKRLRSDLDLNREIDLVILKRAINKVLGQLDQKYREVLVLKFLEEKDYKEISDILKKPTGTIATLINRAKKKFREEIKLNNIQL